MEIKLRIYVNNIRSTHFVVWQWQLISQIQEHQSSPTPFSLLPPSYPDPTETLRVNWWDRWGYRSLKDQPVPPPHTVEHLTINKMLISMLSKAFWVTAGIISLLYYLVLLQFLFFLLGRHLLRMDLLWLLNNILNLLSGGTGWLDTYFELLLSLIIHVFFHLYIAFFLYCIFPEVNLQGYVVATKIIIFCHLISAPPIEDVEFYPFRVLSKLFTPQERKIIKHQHTSTFNIYLRSNWHTCPLRNDLSRLPPPSQIYETLNSGMRM